jgi:hypothetical protein
MFFALTSQSFAIDGPRRSDECTINFDLLTAYPDTWDPYVWNWGIDWGHRVEEDAYSWVHWNDGWVDMRCEDHGGLDFTWLATNFDQGEAQGLIEVDFETAMSLWLETSIYSIEGKTYVTAESWTGAKFDIHACEKGTDRLIHMEMYFWRKGMNTIWLDELARQTDPDSNVWNYLVALDWMRILYGNGYNIEWDEGDRHCFAINVLGLLKRGISLLNQLTGDEEPVPPFDIDNLELGKVILCCEAGNHGYIINCPWVRVNASSIRARYDTADVTGPIIGVPDGKCDIRDVSFVASRFGSVFGDENFDFRADVDTNYFIDITDVSYVAKHFGEEY